VSWTGNPDHVPSAVRKDANGRRPGETAYATRHLYATDALEREVPIATVSELLGHSDTRMVSKVYSKLHQREDHLRAAVEKVRQKAD
jgi:integrase